jgi:hypothetical protein
VRGKCNEAGSSTESDSGGEWQMNQILYADDTALIADKEYKLQKLVSKFGRVSERRKLSVNVARSKVMRVTRRENVGDIDVTSEWNNNGRS